MASIGTQNIASDMWNGEHAERLDDSSILDGQTMRALRHSIIRPLITRTRWWRPDCGRQFPLILSSGCSSFDAPSVFGPRFSAWFRLRGHHVVTAGPMTSVGRTVWTDIYFTTSGWWVSTVRTTPPDVTSSRKWLYNLRLGAVDGEEARSHRRMQSEPEMSNGLTSVITSRCWRRTSPTPNTSINSLVVRSFVR